MEDNIIVAIELGSSKVTGIAGRKQPDGGILVLAVAQEPSASFIRKGTIFNADKTSQCIYNIIGKLQKALKKNVEKVYVGLGGKGLHTVKNTVTKELDTQTSITQDLVDTLLDLNKTTVMTDKEILDVVPQEYKVGTQLETNPVGVLTDRIEGRYVNIVARPLLSDNLRHCFVGIDISARPIAAIALADALLSDTERRSGCVLVDMGAGTTTVSVYKSNILRQLTVLPLGGENITKDIMTQCSVEEYEAENLKIKYGVAFTAAEELGKESADISLEDGRSIKQSVLNEIVEARVEEILRNVAHQIKLSGYTRDQLLGGLIVTGGGANLKRLDKALREFTKFDKLRFARSLQMTVRFPQNFEGRNKEGMLNTALALLDKGTMNCCSELQNRDGGLFGGDERKLGALSPAEVARKKAEEEAQRKAREEEERRRAEEEARQAEEERIRAEKEAAKEAKRAKRKQFWRKLRNLAENLTSDDQSDSDKK